MLRAWLTIVYLRERKKSQEQMLKGGFRRIRCFFECLSTFSFICIIIEQLKVQVKKKNRTTAADRHKEVENLKCSVSKTLFYLSAKTFIISRTFQPYSIYRKYYLLTRSSQANINPNGDSCFPHKFMGKVSPHSLAGSWIKVQQCLLYKTQMITCSAALPPTPGPSVLISQEVNIVHSSRFGLA